MQRRSRSDGGALPGARARALASRLPEAGAALVRVPAIVARSLVAPLTTGDTEAHVVHGGARRGIDIWLLLDAVLAVVLYTVTAVSFVSANEALASPYPPQLMHLLAGGCCLPVALRRRRPVIAWQIAWASTVVTSGWFTALFTDAQFVPGQVIAYLLCLYTLQSRASSPLALGAWLWSLAGIVVIATADPSTAPANAPLWAWAVALVTASLPFGYNMRTLRRAQADLREQRARNEREQAARAVLEERSRIARELHDVVAHNMSVIAIQAEAAPLRARGDAAALAEDLAGIRATALETLTEMRRVLGVLRDREGAADHAPAPGIEQIADLVDKVGAAGPDVRLQVTGTARPVAPGVGVSRSTASSRSR